MKTHSILRGPSEIEWITIEEVELGNELSIIFQTTREQSTGNIFINESFRNSILRSRIEEKYDDISKKLKPTDKEKYKLYPSIKYNEFTPGKEGMKFYRYNTDSLYVGIDESPTEEVFQPNKSYLIRMVNPSPYNQSTTIMFIITFDNNRSITQWIQQKLFIERSGNDLQTL